MMPILFTIVLKFSSIIFGIFVLSLLVGVSSANGETVNRQEIPDRLNDWMFRDSFSEHTRFTSSSTGEQIVLKNASGLNECITAELPGIPEITSITYQSDGETLNATMWLRSSMFDPRTVETPTTNSNFHQIPWHGIVHTMSIDINAVYDTGTDYYLRYVWEQESQKWFRMFEETNKGEQRKILAVTDITDQINYADDHLDFSLDLKKIGNPTQFNIFFATVDTYMNDGKYCTVVDASNWAQIPPPNFVFSSLPSTTIITPGEEATIELQIKSSSKAKAKVVLTTDPSDDLEFHFNSNTTFVPQNGIGTLLLDVRAKDNADPHVYTIPIYSTFTFPTVGKFRGGDYFNDAESASFVDRSYFIVNVEPSPTFSQQTEDFVSVYGGIVGVIISGIIGLIGKKLFDKRREEKKKNTRDDQSSGTSEVGKNKK